MNHCDILVFTRFVLAELAELLTELLAELLAKLLEKLLEELLEDGFDLVVVVVGTPSFLGKYNLQTRYKVLPLEEAYGSLRSFRTTCHFLFSIT